MRYCRSILTVVMLAVSTSATHAATGLPKATEWNQQRAAHLLRRAGFGGTPAQITELAALPLEEAVSRIVDFESIPQTDPPFEPITVPDRGAMRDRFGQLDDEQRRVVFARLQRLDRLNAEELRGWWLRRMVVTPRPFEEKMTLFWHGHFTSGHREVRSTSMMHGQNEMLRRQGLGSYRELLVAVSQDPAMLRYLNNASNRKQAPNENYARELFELFTLGEGNYTEGDVKEAARALTGWTLRGEEFLDARGLHDRGEKTILGRTGEFNGYNLIDIILEQPQAARHLARRLLVFFVTDSPPPALVDAFAQEIRGTRFNLRRSMRILFSSEPFYDEGYRFDLVKSPVELVVGTLRLLEIDPDDPLALAAATRSMGQELFQPPNVKGWDGGRKWINTATLFARYNFASNVLTGQGLIDRQDAMRMDRRGRQRDLIHRYLDDEFGGEMTRPRIRREEQSSFDPAHILDAHKIGDADRVLNHFIERLLQMNIERGQRAHLRRLLLVEGRFDRSTRDGKHRVVSLVNAILSTPEYQLK